MWLWVVFSCNKLHATRDIIFSKYLRCQLRLNVLKAFCLSSRLMLNFILNVNVRLFAMRRSLWRKKQISIGLVGWLHCYHMKSVCCLCCLVQRHWFRWCFSAHFRTLSSLVSLLSSAILKMSYCFWLSAQNFKSWPHFTTDEYRMMSVILLCDLLMDNRDNGAVF